MAFPTSFKPKVGEGTSQYTLANLESGASVKLRVLSNIITGNSVWGEDVEGNRKCTRVRDGESMPVSAIGTNKFTGQPERVKQFIAAVVYNYDSKQLEILETDKATIIEQLYALENTEEYGDLKGYDIKIAKNGQKMDTTYSVIGLPPKSPNKDVLEAYNHSEIDLNKLYTGEDPFSSEDVAEQAATALA